MAIRGIEGMSVDQLNFELQRGGKFVYFRYTISVVILTFRRNSAIHFIKAGENTTGRSIGYTLLTLVAGWWGIPWGPIYTIQSVTTNLQGGKDVTKEVIAALNTPAQPAAPAAPAKPSPIG